MEIHEEIPFETIDVLNSNNNSFIYSNFKFLYQSGLVYMKSKIEDLEVHPLLDLGANTNVLNYNIWKKLKNKPHLESNMRCITGVTGSEINVIGCCTIALNI